MTASAMLLDAQPDGLQLSCQRCGYSRIIVGPRSIGQLLDDAVVHICECDGRMEVPF